MRRRYAIALGTTAALVSTGLALALYAAAPSGSPAEVPTASAPAETRLDKSAIPPSRDVTEAVFVDDHDLGFACTTCHVAPANHFGEDCRTCHADSGRFAGAVLPASRHPSSGACATCHAVPDGHYGTDCAGCHRFGAPFPSARLTAAMHPTTGSCGTCHPAPARHYGNACASCHSRSAGWKAASFSHPRVREHTYRSFACASCHPSGYGSTDCVTCHSDTGEGPDRDDEDDERSDDEREEREDD